MALPLDRRNVIPHPPRRLALALAAVATGIALTVSVAGPASTYADGGSEMISVQPTPTPTPTPIKAHKVKAVKTPKADEWTVIDVGDGTWD